MLDTTHNDAVPQVATSDNTAATATVTVNTPVSETTSNQLNAELLGLRRSSRVPKPRTDLVADLEDEYKKRTYKRKPKPKPKLKAKDKKKVTKPKKKKLKKKVAKKKPGKKANSKSAAKNDTQEPILTESNWAPCTPLLSSDFKSQQSVESRLENPNMKAVPYANDIMKIMFFLNKFYTLFDQDLLNLSFQDFEVGLDLYPGDPRGSADGIYIEDKKGIVYYQDYILVKEVIQSQDKMNLLFLTLLQLLFIDPKKYDAPTLSEISGKNVYRTYITKIRQNASDWGYPKEWTTNKTLNNTVGEGKFPIFPQNDTEPVVDPSHPEILTPNVYTYITNDPLPDEENPLQRRELDDEGILGILPNDRMVLLRTLVDWCTIQSLLIHHEIYQLSHLKTETQFGTQTQHVARYYLDGPEETYNTFRKLCSLVQKKYEIRSKKKHYRKQVEEGKNPELREKFKLLEEIKLEMDNVGDSEKAKLTVSLYDKWERLFQGELNDNPLSDPFNDPIYTLRSQEFFIGRVPYMGDFYLPRLHSYGDGTTMSMYTDLRKLQDLVHKFKNKEYTVFHLFEEYGQTLSSRFKLLYHDTPAMIQDINRNNSTNGKCYWYEMCHDSKSLREFIDFLDYKIVRHPPKEKKKDEKDGDVTGVKQEMPVLSGGNKADDQSMTDVAPTTAVSTEASTANTTVTEATISIKSDDTDKKSKTPKKKKWVKLDTNTHPLPRDQRYNASRSKLQILKEYLSDFYYILSTFEQLRNEYADMKPGRRQLRDIRRNQINYNMDYDSDDDMME
ncbi:hypothetical protein C6P45_002741 [Maudiozyma exigua]|uniref:WHIM1 domain-containing protein n=1 Tax=Maudiozyma exigua TaxID=34358 RepID=A0A9P6VVM6_MAUEX|nr:hypothetical protein C6P45_002741 [Kazachstania exigua]